MISDDFKKYKEFLSVLPLMKELGYDECEARKILIPSKKPDFLFMDKDKNVGIEVTECHPEVTKGKGAKNLMAAMQRTEEICNFIEESQDAAGEVVNYRIGFTFALLFDLEKPKLGKPDKERIQEEVYAEMRKRINNGDYFVFGDGYKNIHKEWDKPYHYIRDIVIDKPLDKSIVTHSYPGRGTLLLEHEYILKAISEKEEKLVLYRENNPEVEEFWLCVNIPMGTNRTLYGFDEFPIETLYDRVYITDHKCVRLK